jgi:hypothetical protein
LPKGNRQPLVLAGRGSLGRTASTAARNVKEHVGREAHADSAGSAFSLFKEGLRGTWRELSAKHLQAYFEEMRFRFNNRKNPCLSRNTILKLIASPDVEYKNLTAKAANAAYRLGFIPGN